MPDTTVDPQFGGGDETSNLTHLPWQDSILDTIRQKPLMHLSDGTLTALYNFLLGYEAARWRHEQKPPELPRDFADWVGYRLRLDSNWSGFWHKAILSRVRDEHLALTRFFELREEYLVRQPHVVASIRKDRRKRTDQQKMTPTGDFVDFVEVLPDSLRIIAYTDDPGFFLIAEEDEGYFYNGWFYPALSCLDWQPWQPSERFEIHDGETWNRLVAEDKRYRRNLNRKRARIQKEKRD